MGLLLREGRGKMGRGRGRGGEIEREGKTEGEVREGEGT